MPHIVCTKSNITYNVEFYFLPNKKSICCFFSETVVKMAKYDFIRVVEK